LIVYKMVMREIMVGENNPNFINEITHLEFLRINALYRTFE